MLSSHSVSGVRSANDSSMLSSSGESSPLTISRRLGITVNDAFCVIGFGEYSLETPKQ
jgi:hypothetical protein